MLITFTGLAKAAIILGLMIATMISYYWPRDNNGKPLSVKEMQKLMNKLPKLPKPQITKKLLYSKFLILLFFTVLAIILS